MGYGSERGVSGGLVQFLVVGELVLRGPCCYLVKGGCRVQYKTSEIAILVCCHGGLQFILSEIQFIDLYAFDAVQNIIDCLEATSSLWPFLAMFRLFLQCWCLWGCLVS